MRTKLNKILLFFLPFLLVGCTNNPTPTSSPSPTSEQKSPVVLIWWNLFDNQKDVQPLIDEYVKQNPNVTVQFISKKASVVQSGNFDQYVTQLDESIADPSQTPDIFPIYNTWAGKYENSVSKAPSSLVNEQYFEDYYAITKKDFYRAGAGGAIALPQSMDAMAIIYNKDRLLTKGYTKPAYQWADFKTMAQQLTVKDGNGNVTAGGFSAGFYENVEFRFEMINLLMLVNRSTMTDVNNTQAIFYDPGQRTETDSAVKFYKDLGSTAWSKTLKKDIVEFLEGRLAMYAAPSWRLIDIYNYNAQYKLNLNIGVAEVPQLSSYTTYWPSYWGYAVSKNSPKTEESWKFIAFLNQKENLQLFNKTVKDNGRPIGIIYPRKSMNTELAQDPILGPYVVSLSKADDWYMRDGKAMKKAFETFFADEKNIDLSGLQNTATSIIKGQ